MKIRHRLFVILQHMLPQFFLSQLMYCAARWTWAPWKNTLITWFVRQYQVDMSIAEIQDIRQYQHFNDFFTRELTTESRPPDQAASHAISPVDGAISQIGDIREGALFQAKGKTFQLSALLGQDNSAALFENGCFATIYLSPRDYHRIHMPIDGQLEKMTYIPGKLFSVNEATTNAVDELFARNERVVCLFETPAGKMALIMVGAIFVGSMETIWAGQITPNKKRQVDTQEYAPNKQELRLSKGQEMGRFNMGSTVILLFQNKRMQWTKELEAGVKIKLGEKLGTIDV